MWQIIDTLKKSVANHKIYQRRERGDGGGGGNMR
jgi:hypothetical protein